MDVVVVQWSSISTCGWRAAVYKVKLWRQLCSIVCSAAMTTHSTRPLCMKGLILGSSLIPFFSRCGYKGDFNVYGWTGKEGAAERRSEPDVKWRALQRPKTINTFPKPSVMRALMVIGRNKNISETDASVTEPSARGHEAAGSVTWALKARCQKLLLRRELTLLWAVLGFSNSLTK